MAIPPETVFCWQNVLCPEPAFRTGSDPFVPARLPVLRSAICRHFGFLVF